MRHFSQDTVCVLQIHKRFHRLKSKVIKSLKSLLWDIIEHVLQDQVIESVVYKKPDEWYTEWQRVTTSGTTSGNEMTTSDNQWQRVVQRMTANDNE